MTLPSSPANPVQAGGAIVYNLAAIATLALLLAVGAAYLIDKAGQADVALAPALGDRDVVVKTIGGKDLTIPARWIRHGEQVKAGFAAQVDLAVELPILEGGESAEVHVTLLPGGRAKPSSTLLDTVYLHQFQDSLKGGIPGLVGKPLIEKEGYQGETVWYDPLSPKPFVAKCQASVEAAKPDNCLRIVRLPSGLAAVFAFEAPLLNGWKSFDSEMALWLDQIGAL